MMPMYFDFSIPKATYTQLFLNLKFKTKTQYVGALIVIFLVAFSIEALSFIRYYILESSFESKEEIGDERLGISLVTRFVLTGLYLINITLSYLLMLMVMNYNGGVFLVTIFGYTLGYFIFGLIKKQMKNAKAILQF